MDEVDQKLLEALVAHGRMSWAELGERVRLSAPAVAERVRRLEADGVIAGWSARLAPEAVGRSVAALIAVTLGRPANRAKFLRWVHASHEVVECHHVAGDDDYLVKVRCASLAALETLVSDGLKGVDGVVRSRTTVVLSTIKEAALAPSPAAATGSGR